jgi:hypothetical protein
MTISHSTRMRWEGQGWLPRVDQEETIWEIIGNIHENPELAVP